MSRAVRLYPFIEAEKQRSLAGAQANVVRACELMKVSRSAYHAHAATQAAGGSRRDRDDADLLERIRHHHQASKGGNGAPRIRIDLHDEGRRHSRKRVARLMREHALVGKHRRLSWKTTVQDPNAAARPDLIARDFSVDSARVNTRWCGDITYIRTWQGRLFSPPSSTSTLAVGWATADHLRTTSSRTPCGRPSPAVDRPPG